MQTAQVWYLVVLLVVVAMRLKELAVARRNTRALLAAGAVEVGAGHYPVMVVLHALFLTSCAWEVLVIGRHPPLWLVVLCAGLLVATVATRWWVITTLGGRWTTRVLWLPGSPRITAGPYRYLRHPNYVAVIVELLALPLLGGAWLTATVFTMANGALLAWRISVEEDAMRRLSAGAGK